MIRHNGHAEQRVVTGEQQPPKMGAAVDKPKPAKFWCPVCKRPGHRSQVMPQMCVWCACQKENQRL